MMNKSIYDIHIWCKQELIILRGHEPQVYIINSSTDVSIGY